MPTHYGKVCELRRPSWSAGGCQAKRIAKHAARGWRSPPPLRREKKREAPGVEAPGVEEGGPEVEIAAEAEGEGMEE